MPSPAAVLTSPWARLVLLVALLGCAAGAAGAAVAWQPQQLLTGGALPQFAGAGAVALFGLLYGLCTAAFVPRPLLNLACGTLLGLQAGLLAAVGGTVLGAAISFGLGRGLGRGALRPLLRGRWLLAADHQLSRHAFRSVLAARIFPGVPFAAVNYCAALSRTALLPFLLATGLGCVPNTAAYVLAGSAASDPGSGAFALSLALLAVSAGGGGALVWWRRRRGRRGQAGAAVVEAARTESEIARAA
ncbi:TVP38/TMEM64 family protein [Streptomyces polyrhachis]|uniref:TVP38/TMEM64 family membrane protein n=1 Tax=Streptomyces polyrhachis TaxID=1282885 RepID=A0ABW2GC67_9ACTN